MTTADGRVRGHYEQTADWPSPQASHDVVARALGPLPIVRMEGLFHQPMALCYRDLVDLAVLDRFGIFAIALIDLFAVARLDVSADMLVFGSLDARSALVSTSEALDAPFGGLVLGTASGPLSAAAGFPARLTLPSVETGALSAMPVTSVEATTFREFVE